MRILSFWISQRRAMSSSQLNSVYTKLWEPGYLLIFRGTTDTLKEDLPQIQQSKMMLSRVQYITFAGMTQTHTIEGVVIHMSTAMGWINPHATAQLPCSGQVKGSTALSRLACGSVEREGRKVEVKTPPQDHSAIGVVSSVHRQTEAFEVTSLPTSRRENGYQ